MAGPCLDGRCGMVFAGMRIKKIPDYEREEIFSRRATILDDFIEVVVEQDFHVPKNTSDEQIKNIDERNTKQLTDIVSTLRLFQQGNFGIIQSVTMPNQWAPVGGSLHILNSYDITNIGLGYVLEKGRLEAFKTFYQSFKSYRRSSIDVAISRFNFSYDRR